MTRTRVVMVRVVAVLAAVAWPGAGTLAPAQADDAGAEAAGEAGDEGEGGPGDEGEGGPGAEAESDAGPDAHGDELRALRERSERLADELADAREDVRYLEERVQELMPVKGRLSGYVDTGFFYVTGTGAGHRPDLGNQVFPELADVSGSWVMMGDPLSTAVNARGEPATTGDSRAIRFDGIGAKSAFLVNALAVRLSSAVGDDLLLFSAFDLVPRGRDISDPDGSFLGDFVDVKLAYLEYRVRREGLELSVFAGKIDSVIGYEYRVQDAPDRMTVTPSLLCRYLCGHPVGVKARARIGARFIANLAVTNGSHFQEQFPFADEIDENRMKTAAARLSYAVPLGDELEIGVSGAAGAQDGQPADGILQHHLGADAHLVTGDVEVVAEYARGSASGATDSAELMPVPCDVAPCLTYQGAYGLASYRATNRYIPYLRVDWRDSLHRAGHRFAYVADLIRLTAGLRVELGSHVILKAEYIHNHELDRIPQFANDVMTSSVIVMY